MRKETAAVCTTLAAGCHTLFREVDNDVAIYHVNIIPLPRYSTSANS